MIEHLELASSNSSMHGGIMKDDKTLGIGIVV